MTELTQYLFNEIKNLKEELYSEKDIDKYMVFGGSVEFTNSNHNTKMKYAPRPISTVDYLKNIKL